MPVITNSADGNWPVCSVWSRTKRSRSASSVFNVRKSTLNEDGCVVDRPAGVRKILPVMSVVVPTASDETGSAASFSRTTYFADEPASMLKRSTLPDVAVVVVGLLDGVVVVDGVVDVEGVGVTPAV